jgi:hypothetical protein
MESVIDLKIARKFIFVLDSNPALVCNLHPTKCGQVAQSVEQGTENPRVGSSILSLATI